MFNIMFDIPNLAFILASILFVLFFILNYAILQKKFHPGPIGLPLVGYLPFLGADQHLKLTQLTKRYGDVFSFRFARTHFVVLGSFDAIKEAATKYEEFAAHPRNLDAMPNLAKWPGLAMNYGNSWARIRRFSMSTLRNFGIGTSSMELKIHDEIDFFLHHLSQTDGQATNIEEILRMSTANTICAVLFGQRFDDEDKTFKKLTKLVYAYMHKVPLSNITSILPACLINLLKIKDACYYGTQLYDSLLEIIEQRANSGRPGTDDNFIDVWLEEQKKTNVDQNNFNNRQLAKVVWDFLIAANDTTATSVLWCLLYVAKYQDIQTKIQKEIDETIGRDRAPSMTDQKQMPFTEAFTLEVSRIAPVGVFLIPKRALKDVKFRHHIVPKDATIISNIWSVNHNSTIFPDPEEFKPERFLNKDGEIVKREELIPFGIGKRQCLGESLGRISIFLYLTSFLRNFSVKPVNNTCIDLIPKCGLALHPKPQEVCIIRR